MPISKLNTTTGRPHIYKKEGHWYVYTTEKAYRFEDKEFAFNLVTFMYSEGMTKRERCIVKRRRKG